ncbi:MAG: cell division ATP-binding protein FtsE [Candidatus Berkelbacteria bacterium]
MSDDIRLHEKNKDTKVETDTANQSQAKKEAKDVVIEFDKVSRTYPGPIRALSDVSFKIHFGEFISLVGPSGAGKSTLIKLLTCAEKPTAGRIMVAGRDIAQLKPREIPVYRRKVGVIFQDFKILPRKTVYENVAFALEVADATNDEIAARVPKIIEMVGLTTRVRAFTEELSGGEKQRVAIARALVHNPKLIIADEPTGNLDPVTTWEIIELLFKINKQGTIVILATHDKEIVDTLEKRVVTLKEGKMISDDARGKYIL